MTVTLEEATVEYDCKTPNCIGKAKSARGQHAYLCPRCIQAKADLVVRRNGSAPSGVDLVAACKVLPPLAKRLQQTMPVVHGKRARARAAAADANDASAGAQALVAEFNDALAAVRKAAETLVKGKEGL